MRRYKIISGARFHFSTLVIVRALSLAIWMCCSPSYLRILCKAVILLIMWLGVAELINLQEVHSGFLPWRPRDKRAKTIICWTCLDVRVEEVPEVATWSEYVVSWLGWTVVWKAEVDWFLDRTQRSLIICPSFLQ